MSFLEGMCDNPCASGGEGEGTGADAMRELIAAIPDVEALLALEPEELGAKLLFLIRARQKQREEMFTLMGMASELWSIRANGSRRFCWHCGKRGLGLKLRASSFPRRNRTAETAGEF